MPRFLAISELPGITEQQFRSSLNEVRKWRFERRAFIVKAFCDPQQGKVVTECEAPDRARFEEWLHKNGWQTSTIFNVTLVHEGGAVWRV